MRKLSMAGNRIAIPLFLVLTCWFIAPAQTKWYTAIIDNAGGKHAFENSKIRYDYFFAPSGGGCFGASNCCYQSGCEACFHNRPMGTAIGKFLNKSSNNENVCGSWGGAGTGSNICDFSKAQVTNFSEKTNYIEYQISTPTQSRWERLYKDIGVLEQQYIYASCYWLDDVLFGPGAAPVFVSYGITQPVTHAMAVAAGSANSIHLTPNWKNAAVLYKGYAMYGFIDPATGHGSGYVVRMGSVENLAWKGFWDETNVINVEFWDGTQRAGGSKRWYFPLTGGRDELLRVGKAIVDSGVPSLLTMTGNKSQNPTPAFPSFDVTARGRNILIRTPGAFIHNVKIYNVGGICVQSASADGQKETGITLPGAAEGIYLVKVRTGAFSFSKIVSITK
ncbi:MAG: T9SS type A sorting domain-containing protein [Chitinivibrionales bacterium]|nr:T9SS type A sorting domain-containing protein [Chitinivibrionales bacterium]